MFFADIKCVGCSGHTERVYFRKRPKLLEPVHCIFKCKFCESHIAVKIRVPQGGKDGEVKILASVAVQSELLKELQEDERKFLQETSEEA